MNDHEIFKLGDVVLQQGATLRDAKLAYKTHGTLTSRSKGVPCENRCFTASTLSHERCNTSGRSTPPPNF
jgi:homoserine acetyltransferase